MAAFSLNAGAALFVESNLNEIQLANKYAFDERLTFTDYSRDMESFATGLKRIQNLCDAAGCQVEYRNEAYGFTVVFSRKRSVTPKMIR